MKDDYFTILFFKISRKGTTRIPKPQKSSYNKFKILNEENMKHLTNVNRNTLCYGKENL